MPICHCKKGTMSQCKVADSYEDQIDCHFFRGASKSLGVLRCMFLNTQMNNHCWSPKAQRIAAHDETDIVDAEDEEELSLGDLIEKDIDEMLPDGDRQYCLDCLHYPCSSVKAAERKKGGRSLSKDELGDLGTGCDNYVDRVAYMATIKGGAAP